MSIRMPEKTPHKSLVKPKPYWSKSKRKLKRNRLVYFRSRVTVMRRTSGRKSWILEMFTVGMLVKIDLILGLKNVL